MSDTPKLDRCGEQNTNVADGPDGGLSTASSGHARTARIRELNDRLRKTGCGGKTLLTRGVIDLDPEVAAVVLKAVKAFEDFGPDNDPWDEHDCASLEAAGVRVIWKIDYYERSGRIHSPDPADPKVTLRVLTVMLADEY